MSDLDSLLDGTLDDLADLPEFKPFPAGAHTCVFDFEEKKVNDKSAVEFKFKAIETVELSNQEDTPVKAGDTCNVLCILKNNDGSRNEFSEGTIKMVAAALKENFPGASTREILTNAKGAEVLIVTTIRKGKDGRPDNMNLKKIAVV